MTWLLWMLAFEVGYLPQGGVILREAESIEAVEWLAGTTYVLAEVELQAGPVVLWGSFRNVQVPMGALSYTPILDDYRAGVSLRWDGVEVGWRHNCWHPVVAYLQMPVAWLEGATDELFARVEVRR